MKVRFAFLLMCLFLSDVFATTPLCTTLSGAEIYEDGDYLRVKDASGLPLFNLALEGNFTIANPEVYSKWTANGSNIYYNDGNVGIGSSSPSYKLDVNGTGRFSSGISLSGYNYFNGAGYWSGPNYIYWNSEFLGHISRSTYYYGIDYYVTTNKSHRFLSPAGEILRFVANNRRVGIWTTNPQYPLHVGGPVLATTYYTGSDERLKKNIRQLTSNSNLEKIARLNPVQYDLETTETPYGKTEKEREEFFRSNREPVLNEKGELVEYQEINIPTGPLEVKTIQKDQIGFLAQELEKEFPELVSTDSEGMKAVNYIGLIPVLAGGIQELRTEINALKKENTELRNLLNSQRK